MSVNNEKSSGSTTNYKYIYIPQVYIATFATLDSASFSNALESELLPFLVNTLEEAMISSNSSYDSFIILALCNIVYAS